MSAFSVSFISLSALLLQGCALFTSHTNSHSFKKNGTESVTFPGKRFKSLDLTPDFYLERLSKGYLAKPPYTHYKVKDSEIIISAQRFANSANYNKFIVPIKYSSKTNKNIKIKLHYPKSGKEIYTKGIGGKVTNRNTISKLKSILIKRIENIKDVSIKTRITVSGEINTEFPRNSILANFKRTLEEKPSRYSHLDEENSEGKIRREASYCIPLKEKYRNKGCYSRGTTEVKIDAYPYRDGSKLVYKASVPVNIYPVSSGKNGAWQKEVSYLKDRLKEIANL